MSCEPHRRPPRALACLATLLVLATAAPGPAAGRERGEIEMIPFEDGTEHPGRHRLAFPAGGEGTVPLELGGSPAAGGPAPGAPPQGPPAAPEGAGQEPPGEPTLRVFGEQIHVTLLSLRVRVVDRDGQPVLGLEPGDFRLEMDGLEVPVASVDWVEASRPWAEEIASEVLEGRPVEAPPEGQRVVLFVQSDFNEGGAGDVRVRGHLAFLPQVRPFLEALPAEDRVAVVSFDSHLRLWQDFTRDREAAFQAVRDSLRRYRPRWEVVPPARGPSLARGWNERAAWRAAYVEEGLEVVARSLEGLRGEKVVIFLGWGLGHNGVDVYRRAVRSLNRAGATVHVLDITYADFHTLAVFLAEVAAATGGTYASTYNFPEQGWKGVIGALRGYYLLTIDGEDLPAQSGVLQIELRDRRGTRVDPDRFAVFPADD